jgi:predicted membrane protein
MPVTDSVVAVFGEQKRRGRWLVRSGLDAKAIFGSVELDLTEAVLEQRELTISATSVLGEVKLIVPEGVMVVNEGTAILGERNMSLSQDQPYTAETPIVHVRGFTLLGSVEAKRPRKKWFKNR